jgi:hypothetical protein
VNPDVGERARTARFVHRADKVFRSLDRDHFAGRADDLGKIDSGIARASSDIEHALAHGDTGSLPAIQNHRTPNAMLQSESCQLLVVGAKDVIALHCHGRTISYVLRVGDENRMTLEVVVKSAITLTPTLSQRERRHESVA